MKTLQIIAFIGLVMLFTSAIMESVGAVDTFINWFAFIGTCMAGVAGGLYLVIRIRQESKKDRL